MSSCGRLMRRRGNTGKLKETAVLTGSRSRNRGGDVFSGPVFRRKRCMRSASGLGPCIFHTTLWCGEKGRFTTTLHVLVSGIIKLARVGTPDVVYRGLSGRSIVLDDFERGFFVEKGAQSFTRDRFVAQKYASWDGEGATSYLLEVREG